jgi:hypothetical protein
MSEPDGPRKTRFNPYMMLFLLAGAVAVAYVALGASLFQQHREKEDVMSQLGSGMAVLATADGVRQDVEDLPGRLAEARRELTAAQVAFPSELDSNNVLKTVLELAGESSVDVRSVETSPPVAEAADAESPAAEPVDDLPPATEPVEETGGPNTLNFDLVVEGDFTQLIAFVEALEEGAASTTRINSFALQGADGRYLLDFELIAHARSTASAASSSEQEGTTDGGTEAITEGEETPRE